ncbi:MAG: quinol:cytochrome C oxidoreductase, partial [Lutibacter sp.]
MYTFSSKLKTFSYALIIVGILGVAYGFFNTPSSVEDVKIMLQESHDTHGEVAADQNEMHANDNDLNDTAHSDDVHAEHAYHYLKNKPWSALYVALFFFFIISLGTLAFYAIQHASQAGWPVVLFRVMEAITAYLPIGGILL